MNRAIKNVLLLAVLGQASLSFAQETVSYDIIEKDPDNYKRTCLYLDLVNVDTYNDISAGFGGKIETVVGNLLMPWFQYRRAWLDAASSQVFSDHPKPVDGLNKQTTTDLGAALFFSSKEKDKSVRVVLRSGTGYVKYIMVPAKVKTQWGVRGGLFSISKALELSDASNTRFHYQSMDGLIDVPIDGDQPQPAGRSYMATPQMRATSMYAGIHLRKVKNVSIRLKNGRKRGNQSVFDGYFDYMIAASTTITDVVDAGGVMWKIAPQEGAIRKAGWRIGATIHSAGTVNVQYSGEFGKRPGAIVGNDFTTNGTYIAINAGITIASGKYVRLGGKK